MASGSDDKKFDFSVTPQNVAIGEAITVTGEAKGEGADSGTVTLTCPGPCDGKPSGAPDANITIGTKKATCTYTAKEADSAAPIQFSGKAEPSFGTGSATVDTIKVEFKSLAGVTPAAPHWIARQLNFGQGPVAGHQISQAITFTGVVTLPSKPKKDKNPVQLRLHNYLAGKTTFTNLSPGSPPPGTLDKIEQDGPREDTSFTDVQADHLKKTPITYNEETGEMTITGEDEPGPWKADDKLTASGVAILFNTNFILYLEYRCSDKAAWKPVGKMTWDAQLSVTIDRANLGNSAAETDPLCIHPQTGAAYDGAATPPKLP